MKSYIYPFEKLEVWKISQDLVKETYEIVSDFPTTEKYNINSQIKRAVISISSNLAEGAGRASKADRAHFTNIAYTSALECMSLILVSERLGFINCEACKAYREKINLLTNKINSYYKYQISNGNHLRDTKIQ